MKIDYKNCGSRLKKMNGNHGYEILSFEKKSLEKIQAGMVKVKTNI